ncbi:MAG: hypothetical protein U0R64_00990 [Candidatus Nanopelagicales bacterium]
MTRVGGTDVITGDTEWRIRRETAGAPDESSLDITAAGDALTLTVAGTGAITVSAEGVVSWAPDDAAQQRLAAIAGDWAWGQWQALHGRFAFHGAVVERDGAALVILGQPRSGASLTALSLCRRGWRLVADGTCPVTVVDSPSRLLALPGPGTGLQVDRAVTQAFPPPEPSRDPGTPRPRSDLAVPTAGPSELSRVVSLQVSGLQSSGVLRTGSDTDPTAGERAWAAAAVAGEALRARNAAVRAGLDRWCREATRLVPVEVALVPPGEVTIFSPRQIADLIVGAPDEGGAS